jgi:uncharacterized protein YhbP (UPF0306 family)
MTTTLAEKIQSFILDHHVLSLATTDRDGLWAASCFYAFDQDRNALLVLSSAQTRHGQAMLQCARIAGTICGQPTAWRDIQGLQFSAQAQLLDEDEHDRGHALYLRRHPLARFKPSDLWSLRLELLKFTDNSHVFGQKTLWSREEPL